MVYYKRKIHKSKKYETELLSLMLNKDEFLRYVTQQYNENNCCTQLEPLIWAIHLSIPKYQRLPLLENILLQSMKYIKQRYSFLPEKQILGKTYEILGIPTICGEPNKYFLNTYKKYKSYYPLRCMKKKPTTILNNSVICDSISLNISQYRSKRCSTPPIVCNKITSSTPNTKKIPSFKINLLLSPIKTPTEEDENHIIISTDNILFHEDDNLKTIKSNNPGEHMSLISKTLELSRANVLNTSQHMFNDIQNLDVTDSNNMDDTQSKMFFISRNPKYVQVSNNTTLSNENNLSNRRSEESLRSPKDENSTTIYFNNLKRVKHGELTFKTRKTLYQEKKNTKVSKECFSEKIKKNVNMSLKYSQKRKTNRIKINKCITKKFYSKSKMNKLQRRKKNFFSDFSLSDLDKTSHIPVTMKSRFWSNKCRKKIEKDSLKLKCNDTWVKNIKNVSTDLESLSNDSTENMIIRTDPPLKLNQPEQDKNIEYYNESDSSNMSSTMFSKDSVFLPNSKINNSHQFELIKDKFMNESQDSCDSSYNYKENNSKNNKMTVSFNKILFEDISETNLKKNLSLLSAIDTSLSSMCTGNTSTSTASKVQKNLDYKY